MKKLFLITIGFFLLSINSSAQQGKTSFEFAPLGAEWWYDNEKDWIDLIPSYSINQFVVSDTTAIDGQPCQIIKHYEHEEFPGTHYDPDTILHLIREREAIHIYSTSDTAFLYNKIFKKFTPFLVFNVEEGDTVCLPVFESFEDTIPNPFDNNQYTYCYVIDSIRIVKYDTVYLKTYFQHSLFSVDSKNTKYLNIVYNWPLYTYYEDFSNTKPPRQVTGSYTKLGGNGTGILPTKILINPLYDFQSKPDTVETKVGLRCYQDTAMSLHLVTDIYCGFDTTRKRSQIRPTHVYKNEINLYPNPTKGSIYLDFGKAISKPITLTLMDNLGRIIKHSIIEKEQSSFDLYGLTPGVYYLRIKSNDREFVKKVSLQ